jgi:peptidyl-prolyl cis-trans isomerase D
LFLVRYQSTTPYNDKFVAKNDLRELFEPVLELEKGEVTQVLQEGGELFALKKLGETADEVRFVVLSYTIQADPIATVDKRAEEADDFTFFGNQDGFEGEAGRRNLDIQSASATKGNDFVAGLGQSRQILNVLKNADEGSVSNPIELSGQFVVLKVNTITPKGPRPYEDVKSQIETTVRTNMRKEKTAQNVASWVENNQSMEALANAAGKEVQSATNLPMSAQTIPDAGREPEVIGAIFSLTEGIMSSPMKGNGAVYVLQVSQHNEANPDAMDNATAQQILQELQKQKSTAFTEVWLEQLRNKAEIEDYRSQVLRNG